MLFQHLLERVFVERYNSAQTQGERGQLWATLKTEQGRVMRKQANPFYAAYHEALQSLMQKYDPDIGVNAERRQTALPVPHFEHVCANTSNVRLSA